MNRRVAIAMILCLGFTMGANTPKPAVVEMVKSEYSVIVFSATWCDPCQRMKRNVWPKDRIKAQLRKYNGKKAWFQDSSRDKAIFKKYGVSVVPTTIILDSKGKSVKRATGYMTVDQLEAFLSEGKIAADGSETVVSYGLVQIVKWMIINIARLLFILLG
jgi:thiol-disulfide isomerase/thioredoxin